jgi:hypothetical protein
MNPAKGYIVIDRSSGESTPVYGENPREALKEQCFPDPCAIFRGDILLQIQSRTEGTSSPFRAFIGSPAISTDTLP